MGLLEVKGVDFVYSQLEEPALYDINLSIEAGEFVAVIGGNGSGKSTLAKLLNVLLLPTAGEIIVDGLNTRAEENRLKIRQRVGMVFQNPDNQLIATMVEDDIAFGPENLGIPAAEIRKRINNSLEMVGMSGYEKKAPHKLSGGQKQRIAIAGIIAMEPSCIVLDEPTAMLDPQGRKEVMDTITFLNKEKGITIIHITHFMEEAIKADRVVVMNQGSIFREGRPREIFKDIEGLKKINLDVPVVVELSHGLRTKGIKLPEVLSIDELVSNLCS
ncbi:energy-coupling factor transporter ATPase [Iocasia frigidifontis]|uniref:Energy-coupling factor transporter ATPase n=1 Tax=Iocasia fonsfrigidae TaxID=2682810 RepID=A0A8A7KCV5_9FIRM|nr:MULTISPECIES: energy-coupling factor transporter ATPase [Halanaerobiaceae]AZO96516.1 energy-coupling factor transporter ATPase [Halocella sp. SP3-1]MTI60549.1 energy-coupling factor transporter ATPase [Bacillota bacterium]QTL99271.1 energy-coupling factor transporter ATPase [Iocasia fonsfrigidae]